MTPERRLEIEQHAHLYGSANGWAGTSGTLATMIRELMAEVDQLKKERLEFATITGAAVHEAGYCDDGYGSLALVLRMARQIRDSELDT